MIEFDDQAFPAEAADDTQRIWKSPLIESIKPSLARRLEHQDIHMAGRRGWCHVRFALNGARSRGARWMLLAPFAQLGNDGIAVEGLVGDASKASPSISGTTPRSAPICWEAPVCWDQKQRAASRTTRAQVSLSLDTPRYAAFNGSSSPRFLVFWSSCPPWNGRWSDTPFPFTPCPWRWTLMMGVDHFVFDVRRVRAGLEKPGENVRFDPVAVALGNRVPVSEYRKITPRLPFRTSTASTSQGCRYRSAQGR
ncbi:hypothetical protein Nham_4146 (plasmid) [Nitrobacter hamburgensis X14]|uniref:Uncharacterized protein n=1 Tax=Nitrobacter hamburgensis (strain DSM 10229 / NCIMB 13809 / X14) TaxID=323097 RepID=Q1QG66_NITHX|nr:hypothetical protein Nham_4146 [Nitrobacter hamburgensis X14]